MTLLDANLLLYAYNDTAPQHAASVTWLENLLSTTELVGLPWVTLWAFLRISTNSRLWPNPKSPLEAFQIVRELLAQPRVRIVDPGPRHVNLLEMFVDESGAIGPKLSDAVLAAIALEHGAQLASTDRDFRRFPSLRWLNPLA